MAALAAINKWLDSLGIATEQEVRSAIGLGALGNLAERLATALPEDRPEVINDWVKGLGGTAKTLVRHRLGMVSMMALTGALIEAIDEPTEAVAEPQVKASEPTVLGAVQAIERRMARIIDAKLIAFKREQADALGLTLAEQWEQVVNRFKRAPAL